MSITVRTSVGDNPDQSWTSRLGRWELWSVPARAIALILTVEALVGVGVLSAVTHARLTSTDVIHASLMPWM